MRLKDKSNRIIRVRRLYELNFTSIIYAIFTPSEKKEDINGDLRRTDQMPYE